MHFNIMILIFMILPMRPKLRGTVIFNLLAISLFDSESRFPRTRLEWYGWVSLERMFENI